MKTVRKPAKPSIWRSLVTNVFVAVALVALLNGWIFLLSGRQIERPAAGRWLPEPEDWFIGLVWTFLFGLMGFARWRLLSLDDPRAEQAAKAIVALGLVSAAYPLYTRGLQDAAIGFVGNVFTAAVAGFAFVLAARIDRLAAVVPATIIAWLCFASLLILDRNDWP